MPAVNAKGWIKSECSTEKVPVRCALRYLQIDTGPRRSPLPCSEILKNELLWIRKAGLFSSGSYEALQRWVPMPFLIIVVVIIILVEPARARIFVFFHKKSWSEGSQRRPIQTYPAPTPWVMLTLEVHCRRRPKQNQEQKPKNEKYENLKQT